MASNTITFTNNELAVLKFLMNSDQNKELIEEYQEDNSKADLKRIGLPAYPVEVFEELERKINVK